MADLPAPLTSFPQFTRLPRELRDVIWRLCLPPRCLGIHYWGIPYWRWGLPNDDLPDRNKLYIELELPVSLPLISRVCRESRREAVRCFKYNGEGYNDCPRNPVLYDDPKPREQTRGRLWFDENSMIYIDAPPWTRLSASPWPNNNNNGDNIDDREIAPELQELLSNPNAPLCIEYNLRNNGWPVRKGAKHFCKEEFVEWALKYIAKRKECTVVIGFTHLSMTYQEACESGLFGLFAESDVVHINVNDDIQNRRLEAVEKFGKMETWKSGSLRDYIRGPDVREDMSRFLEAIWLLWLKKEKLLPRNLESIDLPLSTQATLSVKRLPKFNFVIAVHLEMDDHWTEFGSFDMGRLRIAN
ncbi:hypothetical protein FHL15_007130 [Xylaria flabelliformis]|uniref:2EXR domain-containing protein n=1 Tax=Xylaria flabelliformis TaxID=2512241 RepID=A0A553HVR1_9PEZI|nr:hypothetical protein FHL15_007130 [Xylaria flabelliformis]